VPTVYKPPATQRRYDVCVLGGGLGGAAAGALLARRGHRVLLVEPGGWSAPRLDAGWLLPAWPELLPGFRHLPAAEAVLDELGLTSDAGRAHEPLAPDLQLLLPRARLELSRDPARLGAELRREWPAEAARLEAGLGALSAAADAAGELLRAAPPLPPRGLLEAWTLRRALSSVPAAVGRPLDGLDDHPLGQALRALLSFLSHLDGEASPFALARVAGAAARGLHRAGQAPGLEESFRRRIAESRGELLGSPAEPVRIDSVALDGRRLASIQVAGSPDAYVARAFVLGAPVAWLAPLLGDASASRALGRLRPGRRLAALHRVVRAEAVPPGLGPAALLPGEGGAALVTVAPARREGKKGHPPEAGAGEWLASAWALAPPEGDDAPVRSRLGEALEEVLPFHGRHLVHEHAPAPAPWALAASGEPAMGVGGLPCRTAWKNLFLAGREVLPGLGAEGELYAAVQAAAHAAMALGEKRRP
jgi:hypothetical protein